MIHYVYVHFTKDTLEPFYIGKGKGLRRFKTNSRNRWWKYKVAKHGFVSDILKEFNTNKEALEYEIEMIAFFKSEGIKLVNLSLGGEGSCGVKASEETKRKIGEHSKNNPRGTAVPKDLIIAVNIDTGEILTMLGKSDIVAKGFQPRCVYRCCNNKQASHLNHTFSRSPLYGSSAQTNSRTKQTFDGYAQ